MDDIQDKGQGGAPAVMPEGWARLRAERESLGLSLGEVSAHLKLGVRQLEAIECGDLSALPGTAFARGFVRNYARFLQLDPAPFVALIDAKEGHAPSNLDSDVYSSSLGKMPSAGGARFSSLPAALLVFVLLILLGAGWYYHWFESREDAALLNMPEQSVPQLAASPTIASAGSVPAAAESVAQNVPAAADSLAAVDSVPAAVSVQSAPVSSVPRAVQSAVVAHPAASAPAARASAPAISASGSNSSDLSRIVLAFDGDSWVEVRDATGKNVFSRLNQAGAVQEVQGAAPFSLIIGNAPKVHLTWKGHPVDLTPYIKGNVARITVQ
jgi:cytoskeleton protein RodZ